MTRGPVHDRYRARRGRIVMETRVARPSSTQESLKEQQVREIRRSRPSTVGAHTHPQRLGPDRVLVLDGYSNTPLAFRAFAKGESLRLAEACVVEIPPTRYPASLDECRAAADAIGYPCIVKPRFTAAWNGRGFVPDPGLCYVASAAGLDHAVLTRRQGTHWPVIQRFVPGQGKGVCTVCDHGRPIAWFAHERLRDIRPSASASSL